MALDRAALIVKVGDLPAPLHLQYKTIKDGMPVSLIMERDWGKPLEEICPPNKVFALVEVDPKLESFYMDILQPLNEDKELDASAFRLRKKVLPLGNLASKIGSSDLVEKLRSPEKVGLIDGRSLQASDFLDSLTFTTAVKIVKDLNAVTSGMHNIGSGETYTTFAAFAADVGALTGDITGNQTSSVTETSTALFQFSLNTYTATIKSNAESYGYPNVGYITSINHTGIGMDCQLQDAGGTFEFEKFYLKSISAVNANTSLLRLTGAFASDALIHDIMIDCANIHRTGADLANASPIVKMWNIVSWDARTANNILCRNMHTSSILEHIVSYNSANAGINCNGNNFTLRNCLSMSSVAFDYYSTASMSSFSKCASTDTTGSEASLRSLTASSQVKSLVDTNDEFMNITPGSTIDGAGTTSILTENNEGIRNNPRPNHKSQVSCGATEPPKSDLTTLRGGFGNRLLGGFQ